MFRPVIRLFYRLFLEERSSISLSAFRIATALTVGFVMLPTFVHLSDTYYPTAFKTLNGNFFTMDIIELVAKSSVDVINIFVLVFCVSWLFFLIGFLSQLSCIVLTLSCYYFYALNAFAMGTLSWDILLVTMFLMCITGYHGDYFSVDAFLWGKENAYKRKRPFFVQRLLQLQIGFTFFYTALYKVTAQGNWFTGNPIYYLMNYPPAGVVKRFILKDILMHHPQICYAIGVGVVVTEFLLIFLLYFHRTRNFAIGLGVFFQFLLILTLDVPATFFFLFSPMFLLFINPDHITDWIDQKRELNAQTKRSVVLYDGQCLFCLKSVRRLKLMDLFNVIDCVDLHDDERFNSLNVNFDQSKAMSRLHLIDQKGRVYGGFYAFRQLSLSLPMLYIFIPFFFLPGMGFVGSLAYNFVANHRYLFHFNKVCKNNACFRSK